MTSVPKPHLCGGEQALFPRWHVLLNLACVVVALALLFTPFRVMEASQTVSADAFHSGTFDSKRLEYARTDAPDSDAQGTLGLILNECQPDAPVLDLRQAVWGQGEIFSLAGKWSFYWQALLTGREIDAKPPVTYQVPGIWNSADAERAAYTRVGYGTLHRCIIVPSDITSLYLAVPDTPSAFRLYVNGVLEASVGRVGRDFESEVPRFLPKVVQLRPIDGVLNLHLQVSNHHFIEGGLWRSPELTDGSGIFFLQDWPLLLNVFVFAVLFTIGLYHLAIFAMRSQEKAAAYFGMLCLIICLRTLLVDQRLLHQADWISWDVLQLLEFLCFYVTVPFFAGFIRSLFPSAVSAKLLPATTLIAAVFCFVALFSPVRFFALFAVPYQIVVLIVVVYCLLCSVQIVRQQLPGGGLFATSHVLFSAAIIHDVLLHNLLISGQPVITLGWLAFVVFQSIVLNRRYVKSLSMVEDMSDLLQKRNAELESMSAFKDEFLATTSHELRMPLHSIDGLAKILLKDPALVPLHQQRHNVELISATATRLGNLVNDILDFASIKHSSLDLQQEVVELRSVIVAVIDNVEPLIGSKDIVLTTDVDDSVKFVFADANRVQQILFNLLGNAIKFTEEGFILLKSRRKGVAVEIEVIDTGVGIPPDKMDIIFEPFEKLSQNQATAYQGTGLGLSISRKLVEMQGGEMILESRADIGTTVRFTLPAAEPQVPSSEEGTGVIGAENTEMGSDDSPYLNEEISSRGANHAIKVPTGEVMMRSGSDSREARMEPDGAFSRYEGAEFDTSADESSRLMSSKPEEFALIFFVDDEELNRHLLQKQLQQAGYATEAFAGGGAMLQRLKCKVPDLVVLDLMMPNLNGFEVCAHIREQFDAYELPVIMLTARHQSADIVRALSQGANDYLTKPYHQQELVARIQSLLSVRNLWKAREENQRLNEEINRRIDAESALRQSNERLLQVLNQAEQAMALLDRDLELLYFNWAFRDWFGIPNKVLPDPEQILGQVVINALNGLLETTDQETCEFAVCFSSAERDTGRSLSEVFAIETDADRRQPCEAILIAKSCQLKDEIYIALEIHHKRSAYREAWLSDGSLGTETGEREPLQVISTLSTELNESRGRLDALETALHAVTRLLSQQQSKQAVELLQGKTQNRTLPVTPSGVERREALVELLRISLNYWERYTTKSKTALAEESKCWRVYVDGGTVKTRTFDKYLSPKTLPAHPRWRSVVRTANFVLAQCELEAPDQAIINHQIALIEKLYA
ncbi:MAG: response regulator [Pseudomonadales bacterium]|nr:response regulator [Pseudomonadales bacterium]